MSPRPVTSTTDGRLNLEQQRKRAKELLPHLKAQDPGATLSQAQWQIAKQLGFSSWPKLKAHVDALDFAARHPDFHASDEARTTHWRCGSDIAHTLQLAGFQGQFRMLTDPLCMGPVRDLPAEAFRALRSAFISQAFALNLATVARRVDDEYQQLQALADVTPSVLWCEADAYDQLFLIRVLASLDRAPRQLELIEVAQIPGVERFIGIGQLAPDVLAWLWPQRRLIGDDAVQLAKQAWSAYCDPSPLKLAQLAHAHHPALPLLGPALLRQLQELPGAQDGLSLTERLALTSLADTGPMPFGRLRRTDGQARTTAVSGRHDVPCAAPPAHRWRATVTYRKRNTTGMAPSRADADAPGPSGAQRPSLLARPRLTRTLGRRHLHPPRRAALGD